MNTQGLPFGEALIFFARFVVKRDILNLQDSGGGIMTNKEYVKAFFEGTRGIIFPNVWGRQERFMPKNRLSTRQQLRKDYHRSVQEVRGELLEFEKRN